MVPVWMKQYIPGAFNEEDLPFARSRREYRDFQRFDKAMKDAQSAEKDQLTKNINLAAQIAAGLTSTEAIKHVVNRLCLVSKDPHTRKETAVYAADSIMRHVSVSDEVLLARYEKQLAIHLRNIFKRALQHNSTRLSLADKFFNKILSKWKEKGWFAKELDSIIDTVHKSAPALSKPGALAKQLGKSTKPGDGLPVLPLAEADDVALGEAAPAGGRVFPLVFGATAKAGSPATPAQPDFLRAPGTPRGFRIPSTPMPAQLEVSQAVLNIIPGTPRPEGMMSIPRTPVPDAAHAPFTPVGPAPLTPGASVGGGAAQPFTPAGPAPATPGGLMQPFTPRGPSPATPGGLAQPFTPRGPAPATPGGLSQPFTPRGPAPATPGGLAQPFTPRGPAPATPGGLVQPFTPRGPAPATPGGPAQPFTPRGPAPATPGGLAQPFTHRGPAPATPGGDAQPFTPAVPPPNTLGAAAQPSTPGAQPFTPTIAPGTPRPAPFTPGAPGTPGIGAPGTPGFVPFRGGEAAPVTPAPASLRNVPGTPGTGVPGTPGFIPFRGGEAAPVTPAFPSAHHQMSPHQSSPQQLSIRQPHEPSDPLVGAGIAKVADSSDPLTSKTDSQLGQAAELVETQTVKGDSKVADTPQNVDAPEQGKSDRPLQGQNLDAQDAMVSDARLAAKADGTATGAIEKSDATALEPQTSMSELHIMGEAHAASHETTKRTGEADVAAHVSLPPAKRQRLTPPESANVAPADEQPVESDLSQVPAKVDEGPPKPEGERQVGDGTSEQGTGLQDPTAA